MSYSSLIHYTVHLRGIVMTIDEIYENIQPLLLLLLLCKITFTIKILVLVFKQKHIGITSKTCKKYKEKNYIIGVK